MTVVVTMMMVGSRVPVKEVVVEQAVQVAAEPVMVVDKAKWGRM